MKVFLPLYFFGTESVYGLRSIDGQTLTINIGMDYVNYRLITIITFTLFCFAMVTGGILAMFKKDDGQNFNL